MHSVTHGIGEKVGCVSALWRYPVKSMAGESLPACDVSWHGLAGDRRWAFVREDRPRSGFPWLTQRERPAMAQYRPRLADPQRPDDSGVLVRTPAGDELDITDPALLAALGGGARLLKQDRGSFDAFPLSLVTTRSIDWLARRTGTPPDARRFRPNLVVDACGPEPFPEDAWVGRVLRIGGLRLRLDRRDGRCVMTTIDPDTLQKTPAILRTIATERGGCLGVYGSTVAPGRVAVGDAVVVE